MGSEWEKQQLEVQGGWDVAMDALEYPLVDFIWTLVSLAVPYLKQIDKVQKKLLKVSYVNV